MRILLVTVALSAGILSIKPITTSAYGNDPHSGHTDAQMEKLHAMMPVFSAASAELESALEKGDAAAAKAQAARILASVTDLKKSKPHKNIKQRKKFIVLATNLKDSLTITVDLAQKGDFLEAKAAFKKVEEICAACHAKFRN